MSTHACERCEIDHPWRECEPWPESKGQMKTIAELEQELNEVTLRQNEAWIKHKEAEKSLEPITAAWLELYKKQERLGQVLAWRKEMEAAQ